MDQNHPKANSRSGNCGSFSCSDEKYCSLPPAPGTFLPHEAIPFLGGMQQSEIGRPVLLAASSVPYGYVLPALLAEFNARRPNVTFELHPCNSAGVAAELLSGKAELGMAGTQVQDLSLHCQHFVDDSLVVITPAVYTERPEAPFPLSKLAKAPFITREEGSGTRRETWVFLQRHGLRPDALNLVAQMDGPDAIKNAVSGGLGLSVMSKRAAADYARAGRLKIFEPEGGPLRRGLYIVHHRQRPLSPGARQFLQFLFAPGPKQ